MIIIQNFLHELLAGGFDEFAVGGENFLDLRLADDLAQSAHDVTLHIVARSINTYSKFAGLGGAVSHIVEASGGQKSSNVLDGAVDLLGGVNLVERI